MGFRFTCNEGDIGRIQESLPCHCTIKIETFSLLSKTSIDRLESGIFEAVGYKWKLAIYPNGNKRRSVENHISLYLTIVDTSTLPSCWGFKAVINFFMFDQNHDKYIAVQDGISRSFNGVKTEWGLDKFISIETFNNPSNGFLVDDTCVFGAEVFVCQESNTSNRQLLSMINDAVAYKHTWNIKEFSLLQDKSYYSKPFTVEDHEWQILIYPKGNLTVRGKYLSIYLSLDKSPGHRVYVGFTLRVIHQTNGQNVEKKSKKWFDAAAIDWGFAHFLSLSDINDQTKGYLVNDCCIVEAEVQILGFVKKLP